MSRGYRLPRASAGATILFITLAVAPRAAAADLGAAIAKAIATGDYAAAEAIASEFEQESAKGGSLSDAHLAALDLRVKALILNGRARDPESLALARLAMGRQGDAASSTGSVRLQAVLNLADTLAGATNFDAAVRVLERQLAVWGETSERVDRADLLDHLAIVELQADHTDRAVGSAERAIAIRRASTESSNAALASTLLVSALALQRHGQYRSAGTAIREAVSLLAATQPAHPTYAEALSLLSLQVWFEGNLVEAHDLSQQALDLARQVLRKDHPLVAQTLRRLAVNKILLGDIGNAHNLLEEALGVASRAFPTGHIDVWPYLNDLAEAHRTLGHYSDARRLLERGRRIAESQLGQWHDSVATSLHNLALVDAAIGDYERARQEQILATSIWERVLGPRHPFVAVALTELAEVYRAGGAAHLALPLLRRALTIRQQRLGARHPDVARTLTDLSATLLALDDIDAAEDAIGKALAVWGSVGGAETLDTAKTYRSAGAVYGARGQWKTAKEFYGRSLAVLEGVLGRAHPSFAEALADMAAVLNRLKEHDDAIVAAAEAERNGQAHLRLTIQTLSERQGLTYAAQRPRAIDTLFAEAPTSTAGARAAFDSLIRGRALVLDEMIARRGSTAYEDGAAVTRARLAAARQQLANLAIKGTGSLTVQQYNELLAAARLKSDALEADLAAASAPFRETLSRSRVGLAEVRAHLPLGSALVSYVRFRRPVTGVGQTWAYLALVLTSADSEPAVIDLGRAEEVDSLVVEWRRQVQSTSQPRFRVGGVTGSNVGTTLRRRVWDPVAMLIGQSRRAFVVPDGALSLLPLAGLPTERGRFLIEDGPTIHYLATERDLVPQQMTTKGTGLLALGGPAFDDASSFAAGRPLVNKSIPVAPDITRGRGLPPCSEVQRLRFDALPGSKREIETIGQRWQEWILETSDRRVDMLAGESATESALKARSPGHRVLHIATHGFFIDDDCAEGRPGTRSVGRIVGAKTSTPAPTRTRRNKAEVVEPVSPLLRAGLALAGANRRALAAQDDEDGILTAAEVASLSLEGTEWAVLSACDTGLGEAVDGEGVLGLRRAFQIAGAHSVIMSAWAVDDDVTGQWMDALYDSRLVRRLETDEAIRAAGLTLLARRRDRGLDVNPFYWAGFVAAGDWR